MQLCCSLTFKQGPEAVATIRGRPFDKEAMQATVANLTEQVIETEQFLERLTGLRTHISVERAADG